MRPVPLLSSTVLAVGLAACGGGASPSLSAPTSTPTSSPSPAVPFDAAAPVLALTSVCYGACGHVDPLGLPELAVYADGRVVRAEHQPPDPRSVLTQGSVDEAALQELLTLARAAGLDSGGEVELGFDDSIAIADGGGEVLTGRLDGATTTVESPHPYDAGLDAVSTDGDRRAALRELSTALRGLEVTQPYDPGAVVVQARPAGATAFEVEPWPGPPLAELPPADGDARCDVVRGASATQVLTVVSDDRFPSPYDDGGQVWTVAARPVLPHEQDCADVAATVRTSRVGDRAVG